MRANSTTLVCDESTVNDTDGDAVDFACCQFHGSYLENFERHCAIEIVRIGSFDQEI